MVSGFLILVVSWVLWKRNLHLLSVDPSFDPSRTRFPRLRSFLTTLLGLNQHSQKAKDSGFHSDILDGQQTLSWDPQNVLDLGAHANVAPALSVPLSIHRPKLLSVMEKLTASQNSLNSSSASAMAAHDTVPHKNKDTLEGQSALLSSSASSSAPDVQERQGGALAMTTCCPAMYINEDTQVEQSAVLSFDESQRVIVAEGHGSAFTVIARDPALHSNKESQVGQSAVLSSSASSSSSARDVQERQGSAFAKTTCGPASYNNKDTQVEQSAVLPFDESKRFVAEGHGSAFAVTTRDSALHGNEESQVGQSDVFSPDTSTSLAPDIQEERYSPRSSFNSTCLALGQGWEDDDRADTQEHVEAQEIREFFIDKGEAQTDDIGEFHGFHVSLGREISRENRTGIAMHQRTNKLAGAMHRSPRMSPAALFYGKDDVLHPAVPLYRENQFPTSLDGNTVHQKKWCQC